MPRSDQLKLERFNYECYLFYRNDCCDTPLQYGVTTYDQPITLEIDNTPVVFVPGHIKRSEIVNNANDTESGVTIQVAIVDPQNPSDAAAAQFVVKQAEQWLASGLSVKVFRIYSSEEKALYLPVEDYSVAFWGDASSFSKKENVLEVEFKSWFNKLTSILPRNFVQQSCNHNLYDPNTCRANRASFTYSGTVEIIANNRRTVTVNPDIPLAADQFIGGLIRFNDCIDISINNCVAHGTADWLTLTLINPVPDDVLVTSTVAISFGCNRTVTDCASRFNNTPNFGGFINLTVGETTDLR